MIASQSLKKRETKVLLFKSSKNTDVLLLKVMDCTTSAGANRKGSYYSSLPMVLGREVVNKGVGVWGGGGSCQSVSIFSLQAHSLSHPVHPFCISPTLTCGVLSFPRQPPPTSLWRRPPTPLTPRQPSPPLHLDPNCWCNDYYSAAATRGVWVREGKVWRRWRRHKEQKDGGEGWWWCVGGKKGKKRKEAGKDKESSGPPREWGRQEEGDRNPEIDALQMLNVLKQQMKVKLN